MAYWFGFAVYIVRGPCSLGQIVITASTRMSPRRQVSSRRIVESSDEESLPETWEEMQRHVEPVSPAVAPEQRQVITIDDDDDTPQQSQVGVEPSFEVLLSMTEDVPAPPPTESAPQPQEPEPPQDPRRSPQPQEPVQPQDPRPPEPAPDSPQPGPSGIQEMNDDGTDERLEEQYFRTIDESVGTIVDDNRDYASFQKMKSDGIHIVNVMMEHFRDTVNDLHNFKEAYRSSRRACKRKLEKFGELEASCKKFKEQADGYASREQEAVRGMQEAIDANEILHRQLATVESEARDYMEQRDQAEAVVDQLKVKLTQEKSKTHNIKKYAAALKGVIGDKDKTIARLEVELTQTRTRLHQFTRISVPRGPAAAQGESSSSSEDEN